MIQTSQNQFQKNVQKKSGNKGTHETWVIKLESLDSFFLFK